MSQPTDEDVQRAFQALWQARRGLAAAKYAGQQAAAILAAREREIEEAENVVRDAEADMQRLAERSAGVDDLPPDDRDVPPPRSNNGYAPISRRAL